MFVRAADEPVEYSRDDTSFYKGIVVKNDDPLRLMRVKVFIPELTNQPLEDWLAEYTYFSMRFPGKNNKTDSWSDTKIFETIAEFIPWAEPCFPVMGEGSPGTYHSPQETATISDTNYTDYFETNNDIPPSIKEGAFSPSWFYENYDTALKDPFSNQNDFLCVNNNPYSYIGRPSSHVNKAKGMFGIPSVGTKVWIFHYHGDVNFPVYFGVRHDYRETSLMYDFDQPKANNQSLSYPGDFENKKQTL
jgi:hypothetical protein